MFKEVTCGVPQGSILGPLLFLVYINDNCKTTDYGEFILFADDTNLFYSHENISTLTSVINTELCKISDWLQSNKLEISLNIKKSNYIIFKPRQKRQVYNLALTINNNTIDRVKEVCFLGVILDENLTWKAHVSYIARKISKSIGIIYRSSFYLFKSALRILYFALVYPYLQYCVTIWGSTYSSNLNRIVLLQKRAVQIVDKQFFGAHTTPIFYKHKILKFEDIYLLQLGKFMYLYQQKLPPDCFEGLFSYVSQIHNYNTRNAKSFYAFQCRTNIRQFSINYQGPKFFNTLNPDIRNSSSVFRFQYMLKLFLFSHYI